MTGDDLTDKVDQRVFLGDLVIVMLRVTMVINKQFCTV